MNDQQPGPAARSRHEGQAAAWEGKFRVYHARRFGAVAPVRAFEVRDFLRFIEQRWQAPEWQVNAARRELEAKFGTDVAPAHGSMELIVTEMSDVRDHPSLPRRAVGPRSVDSSDGAAADLTEATPAPPASLAEAVLRLQGVLRLKHYSWRTEQAYGLWLRRYWSFLQEPRRRAGMAQADTAEKVRAFLEDLAVAGNVAASTQNQALNALVFFYREVMRRPVGDLGEVLRAKKPRHLPAVLSVEEVRRLLDAVESGTPQLMARLLYGTGLRLIEMLQLRIKDVDFARGVITVRGGKGNKDRVTMLPGSLREPLQQHVARVKQLHQADLKAGEGKVWLPEALERKYPAATREWGWQWVFPAKGFSRDPRTGRVLRHQGQTLKS